MAEATRTTRPSARSWLLDMDGMLAHEERAIPGADRFLDEQWPGGSAFAIGEAGLTTALHEAGYTLTDRDPDYVVLGETRTYSFERITRAILVLTGVTTREEVERFPFPGVSDRGIARRHGRRAGESVVVRGGGRLSPDP